MEVLLHADDLGRSKGTTDSILETVDAGVIESVSILMNGAAYEYALTEWKKRPNLLLVLHFNITEGRALSNVDTVSQLVDREGQFKYSPFILALRYYTSTRNKRRLLREQIREECRTQLQTLIRDAGDDWVIRFDSHNHVHMLPFVMDEVSYVLEGSGAEYVRLMREPLYLPEISVNPKKLFEYVKGYVWVTVMGVLSLYGVRTLRRRSLPHSTACIGIFATGRMNQRVVESGLAAVGERAGVTEVIFHPGGAARGEERFWALEDKHFKDWYFSNDRALERAALLDQGLIDMVTRFRNGTFEAARFATKLSTIMGTIIRFLITGTLAALVHLFVLYLFTEYGGLWYVLSSAIGFGFGFLVSFTLQKYWTFEDSRKTVIPGQALKYFLLQMFGLSLNLSGIYIMVEFLGLWYFLAQFILLIVVAVITFVVSKLFIFERTHQEQIA